MKGKGLPPSRKLVDRATALSGVLHSFGGPLQLAVFHLLVEPVGDLLSRVGHANANVPTGTAEKFESWRQYLVAQYAGANGPTADVTLLALFGSLPFGMTADEKASQLKALSPLFCSAAREMVEFYDRTVKPALKTLQIRTALDPRCVPPPIVPIEGAVPPKITLSRLRAFFGMGPDDNTLLSLGTEYTMYRDSFMNLPLANREDTMFEGKLQHRMLGLRRSVNQTPFQFWNNAKWPTLRKFALRKLELTYSSISVERFFGVMRAGETLQRLSQKEQAFAAEMMFKCNKYVLNKLFEISAQRFTDTHNRVVL